MANNNSLQRYIARAGVVDDRPRLDQWRRGEGRLIRCPASRKFFEVGDQGFEPDPLVVPSHAWPLRLAVAPAPMPAPSTAAGYGSRREFWRQRPAFQRQPSG